ncbi:uncharacterized protein LOC142621171 isoform X3 [Castanea sativa]|uniref:uncharacterized protein LOC142621171 isoform X3 n=1 Tax=Castanea sativa TaxID=21020 RepID=UPI003F652A97
MAKFNVMQRRRRAQIAERKRAIHGDPTTGKLKNRPQPLSISGKRKRKLLKKWRREQKDAIEKGLVSMEDVEMAASQESGRGKAPLKRLKGSKARPPLEPRRVS